MKDLNNKFQYEHFIGDGDSSACNAVNVLNGGNGTYKSTEVKKLECINHVQNRMGTRLRKLRDKEKVEIKAKTGKTVRRSLLSGKNKLSDMATEKLKSYFGRTIRTSVGKTTVDMKVAAMSSFHHVFSTDAFPWHGLCPKGPGSWCSFQKERAAGKDPDKITKKASSLIINID